MINTKVELMILKQGQVFGLARKIFSSSNDDKKIAICDVDNTLYRADRIQQMFKFAEALRKRNWILALASGVDFKGIKKRIESGELPCPDVIIGQVGTEIVYFDGTDFHKDEFYEAILETTGFNRALIVRQSKKFASICNKQVSGYEAAMHLQEADREAELLNSPDPEYQRFKVSYHFFAKAEDVESIRAIAKTLYPEQLIIICEEINNNRTLSPDEAVKKYCLDIVPATKAMAVRYVMSLLNVDFGLIAGDSGNDTDMLLMPNHLLSVIVGGAKPELVNAMTQSHMSRVRDHEQFWLTSDSEKAAYLEEDPDKLGPDSLIYALNKFF